MFFYDTRDTFRLFVIQVFESQAFWDSEQSARSTILECIWRSRSPGTIRNYCYALRKFFEYLVLASKDLILPIDALSASNYLSYLKESGAKLGAIKSAYNAMKWAHNFVPGISQFNDPLDEKFVKRVFECAQRSVTPVRNIKAPLSKDIIKGIFDKLSPLATLKEVRDATIVCLAFSLLLRHDEVSHLCCSHIHSLKNSFKFKIVSSKTDKLRAGKDVFLAKSEGTYSTFNLLRRYLSLARLSLGQNHFLFGPLVADSVKGCHILNQKLSYSAYRLVLKSTLESVGVDSNLFGFHSCRSGGATDLASSVTPYELITAGRWKDQRSLAHYVDISQYRRLEWSKALEPEIL